MPSSGFLADGCRSQCLQPASIRRAALTVSQLQVYRIRLLQAPGLSLIREVVEFMSFTRRQILGGLAGLVVVGVGAGGASRYWLGKMADDDAGHDYELIAAPLDVELVAGHKTQAWAFGPSAPGTELRVRQGEWLRVRFINHLPVATTIHWHGIRLPLEMDGVPYVSQLPVLPGEYFDYKFRVPDAGSYWYHPHVNSSEELGRGLVGPLIIEEREPTGFKYEKTLSLKSWHVDEVGNFVEFSIPREAARGGTAGRLATINGVPQAVIDLPAGQITRVRILNLDNTLTYRLNIPGVEAQIYALDGNPVEPRPLGKEYWLGPGMRICLAIKAPAAGEELSLRNGPVRLGTLRSVANTDAPSQWPPALPANPIAEPDLANAVKLNFNFEWVGSVSVNVDNGKPPSLWQINGKAWDITDKTCADRPIAKLEKGKSYIFELKNMTQYQHPIHLHGMSFKVIASNRHKVIPYFTDTYLLGKNERAQVALVADNPGIWMFHCHVIDHMETGLMAAIEVACCVRFVPPPSSIAAVIATSCTKRWRWPPKVHDSAKCRWARCWCRTVKSSGVASIARSAATTLAPTLKWSRFAPPLRPSATTGYPAARSTSRWSRAACARG